MKDKMHEGVYSSILKWFHSKKVMSTELLIGFYEKWLPEYFLKKDIEQNLPIQNLDKPHSTLKDWLQANDLLESLIRKCQAEMNLIQVHSLTFDLLGLSAYLMRLHLCLVQHKKYYQIYERREAASNDIEKEKHLELSQVRVCCEEVYDVLEVVISLLKETDIKKQSLKAKVAAFSDLSALVEKQTETLARAAQRLNETVLKEIPIYHLLGNDLFKLTENLDPSKNQLILHSGLSFREPASQIVLDLKKQADGIKNTDLKKITCDLLVQYEILSKYLIFTHSTLLTETFSLLHRQIKQLIEQVIQLESENKLNNESVLSLHPILNSIFRTIQSIRFITNKKDSFTRNLQKAACSSTRQLRKSLDSTKVGQHFLNLYYRMDMREKLKMRSRFKP